MDTVNQLVYALAQFGGCFIGDKYDLRLVLPISFFIQAICYTGLAIGGSAVITSQAYYYLWFIIIGVIQSINFPAFVSIIANWFPKSSRGIAVNGFCTCVNIGDIIGA